MSSLPYFQVDSSIDADSIDAVEGGADIRRLFETVEERLKEIDRFETLHLHEAAAARADAVEKAVMREREVDNG